MRILFAGTPEIAVPALRALHQQHEIVGVLCAPDAPAGRGRELVPCPVKLCARELDRVLLQPEKLDAEARELVAALKPDLLVCVAYGKIFGPRFLALFPAGGINLHPSLLPLLRGPSPIASAILHGHSETGLTVQRLALEMDAGDILIQERRSLDESEDCASLTEWAAKAGAAALLRAVAGLADSSIVPRVQDHEKATYCHMIDKHDGTLDWNTPAREICRKVRAYKPWPRAWTRWQGQLLYIDAALALEENSPEPVGTVLRIDKSTGILVQTGEGLCALQRLQLQGKKALDAGVFVNGARSFIGSVLGENSEKI